MKKIKITAMLLAAVLAVTPAFGCRATRTKTATNSESSASNYADMPEVGKNKTNVDMNQDANVNSTTYKLNQVIDSGRVKDGLKYIYLDVTIKNESDEDYKTSGLNNFYLILEDGTEVTTDVRADIYAKQSLTGYEQLLNVRAGEEYSGYVGFCLEEDVESFTVGFFPTANTDSKEDVIFCEVKEGDIVPAPAGLFVESNQ